MSKKMFCLFALVLLLGLSTTVANADIGDGLVAYWPLDEGGGATTADASGNGNDGTLNAPTWDIGKFGGALNFDGTDDYVDCGNPSILDFGTGDWTISAWIKVPVNPGGNTIIFAKGGDGSGGIRYAMELEDGSGGVIEPTLDDNSTKLNPDGDITVIDGHWHHFVAMRKDGTKLRLYVDGVEDPGVTGHGESTIPANYDLSGTSQHNAYIGAVMNNESSQLQKFFAGLIDDVALWNRALTPEEISYLFNNGDGNTVAVSEPGKASEPSVDDEAGDVPRDVVLSWTPGEFAAPTNGHKVYFGESFDDVNDSAGGVAQSSNSYAPAQRLDFGTTYYWRVDEVNAPPTSHIEFKGDVWQFTTEPVAYAIENIIATASSSCQADAGPENTINGSGLGANDLHSTKAAFMWLSGDEPNWAWIEYELEKVHKLHEMWVWNSNQSLEPIVGLGFKDVSIEYSVNGTDYTTLGTTHEFAQAPGTAIYAHNTTVDFGSASAKYIRLTANSNWGGLMPRHGLSEVRFFSIPVYAREPGPDSGTTDVSIGTIDEPVDVTLYFRSGRDADMHHVYFSTDEQAVIDGNAPVATVTGASYGPLSLDLGKTYYWRVDEVNYAETPSLTTCQGDIWNFRTQEYFVVDDFEDYNDYPPDEIWSTWVDGYGVPTNGATVGYPDPDWNQGEHYVETSNVHGGAQAMPYFYDNSAPSNYSEATLTLSSQRDWTMKGAGVLSLRFKGKPAGFVEGPAGTYTMTAAGSDIWNDADEFRYAYKQLSGDCSIFAQVLSVEDTDNWAKAGVMIRETLDAGSKFAALYLTPDNGCRFQARLQTGVDAISDSSVTTLADVNTPHWVKLERIGDTFNAYDSNDGVTWTPLVWNPQTISMDANVYVGLALTSHNSGVTCVAEFSDVQTSVSGPFTQQAIGVEMPTNDPAPMYVALNGSAAVYHDNPNAAQINTWTEWSIDLQEFAAQGVNLTNVNTLSIGFGDKNNLQPGGSGVLNFDDIRLYRSNEPEQEPEP